MQHVGALMLMIPGSYSTLLCGCVSVYVDLQCYFFERCHVTTRICLLNFTVTGTCVTAADCTPPTGLCVIKCLTGEQTQSFPVPAEWRRGGGGHGEMLSGQMKQTNGSSAVLVDRVTADTDTCVGEVGNWDFSRTSEKKDQHQTLPTVY